MGANRGVLGHMQPRPSFLSYLEPRHLPSGRLELATLFQHFRSLEPDQSGDAKPNKLGFCGVAAVAGEEVETCTRP